MTFLKYVSYFFLVRMKDKLCRNFDFTWTHLCVHIWLTIFITHFQLVSDLPECNCCISLGMSMYTGTICVLSSVLHKI